MPRYRKKPVEIDAIPVHAVLARHFSNDIPLEGWAEEALRRRPDVEPGRMSATVVVVESDPDTGESGVNVETAEGIMFGPADHWLIRGVEGELYPCKPSVFEATYERVGAA